jgi:hypothetical protein
MSGNFSWKGQVRVIGGLLHGFWAANSDLKAEHFLLV